MNATNIRINGRRPTDAQLTKICRKLESAFRRAGFEAWASVGKSSTSLRIGGNQCQFKIIPAVLGYNANIGYWNAFGDAMSRGGVRGYVRTTTPTWNQRVQFNNLVNRILDESGVTCHIKSGPFTIRTVRGGAEHDWNEADARFGSRIVALSSEMERAGEARVRAARREAAAVRRAKTRPQLRLVAGVAP